MSALKPHWMRLKLEAIALFWDARTLSGQAYNLFLLGSHEAAWTKLRRAAWCQDIGMDTLRRSVRERIEAHRHPWMHKRSA